MWGRALSCKIKTPFSSKSGLFACRCRCSRNFSTMCNFFTYHSAVFLQYLDTRSTLWPSVNLRGRPDFGSCSMLNLPSWKRWAQREIVLRSTVSTPHTSISELWISVGVFPRNVSILMYARWSSLVTVPETRTAAISMLCRFQVHTPPETNYTAVAARSSPVQLLKWRERLRNYLRSVTNVCISFEIPHIYIYIYTRTHIYIHIYTHTYIYILSSLDMKLSLCSDYIVFYCAIFF